MIWSYRLLFGLFFNFNRQNIKINNSSHVHQIARVPEIIDSRVCICKLSGRKMKGVWFFRTLEMLISSDLIWYQIECIEKYIVKSNQINLHKKKPERSKQTHWENLRMSMHDIRSNGHAVAMLQELHQHTFYKRFSFTLFLFQIRNHYLCEVNNFDSFSVRLTFLVVYFSVKTSFF